MAIKTTTAAWLTQPSSDDLESGMFLGPKLYRLYIYIYIYIYILSSTDRLFRSIRTLQ